MSKAEQRALEAYPPKYVEQERHSKRVQSEKVDTHQPMRTIYIKGYRQTEKDLELTWGDISIIRQIMFNYNRTIRNKMAIIPNDEEYCKEVLNRFNKQKGK